MFAGPVAVLADDSSSSSSSGSNLESPSSQDAEEQDNAGDASKLRRQHLLSSLVIACRFQPSANIMAGRIPHFHVPLSNANPQC